MYITRSSNIGPFAEELATLKRLGVPYGQGYDLGKPEPLVSRAMR